MDECALGETQFKIPAKPKYTKGHKCTGCGVTQGAFLRCRNSVKYQK